MLNKLDTEIGFGSTEFHVLRAVEISSPAFLFYITRTYQFRTLGEAFMTGAAGQKRVPTDFIEEFFIALPSLSEQTTIAAFLDRKTAEIDSIISKKERLIELYEEEKAAVINHAVTKGLDPSAKMKDSGIEWLGEIPENWEVKRLKFLSEIISKGTTPSTIGREILISGDIRFLKAENIKENKVSTDPENYIDQETDMIIKRSRLKSNDILFVIAGATIGKVAILPEEFVPSNTNQAVAFIRIIYIKYIRFIWLWLQSNKIKQLLLLDSVQSAQPNLSMECLGNFYLPFPRDVEQLAIVQHIETKCSYIDAIISKFKRQIELLKEYRTALISEAVTGKIDVRNQI